MFELFVNPFTLILAMVGVLGFLMWKVTSPPKRFRVIERGGKYHAQLFSFNSGWHKLWDWTHDDDFNYYGHNTLEEAKAEVELFKKKEAAKKETVVAVYK